MTDFEAMATPAVRDLRAYDPGHDLVALRRAAGGEGLLELGSNESASGASARARAAAAAALDAAHVYPDPTGSALKQALARTHGVAPSAIALGNGSHEILMQLAQVFAAPRDEVVASRHGFAVYAIAARASGAALRLADALPPDAAMPRGHDLDALLAQIGPRTKLVYLANPNNPTGTWFSADAFSRFMVAVAGRAIVVVDEAYAEFADAADYGSAVPQLAQHANLVVTRTFSKAYGLAGLRVGYALGDPRRMAMLERVRESFNVNAPALAAAEAALADVAHLEDAVAANRNQRAALAQALAARGLRVAPSQGNFLLVDFGRDAEPVEAGLLARGVIVRPMGGYGLPHCLRITVGTAAQNARLLAALEAAMAEEVP